MINPIYWFDEKQLKKKIVAEYSSDNVQKHLEYLTTLIRRAGTDDELKAATYIKSKLDEHGIEAKIHEVDAYVSILKDAELEVLHPVKKSLSCISGAFTPPTDAAGIEGELILTDSIDQKADLTDKIVLIGGDKEKRKAAEAIAQKKGVAAKIYITPGKSRSISVERLKSTWGNPTPETMDLIPQTPAISICNEDGHYLTELIKKGSVIVKLKADSLREYRQIHLPVGMVRGVKEPEKFILFGVHYCSWFTGASDNAAANSLMIEMARIFSKYRKFLGRSIRFAWWSGHEQGTFAGSTWYADTFWDDIRDNAVAYLVMDGLGRIGSFGYECRNTEEIRSLHETAVKDTLGLQITSKRITKTGDQSFHGMGLPSFTGKQDMPSAQTEDLFTETIWYSHSAMDTIDKVDIHLLAIPFKVNAVSTLRLCNSRILPFEFVTLAEVIQTALTRLKKIGKSTIDLAPLITQANTLKQNAVLLKETINKNIASFNNKKRNNRMERKFKAINTCLMALSRILIPVLSSRGGKYKQDPAGTPFKPLPTLQPLEKLSSMDPNSQEYKALLTLLVRERNKISDAIHSANQMITNTLNSL